MSATYRTGSVFARVIPVLLGGAFLTIGASLAVMGWRDHVRMRASREWPAAEATVLRSEVRARWHSGSRRHGAGRYHYSPDIAYAYMVGDVRYEGDREDFVVETSSSRGRAEAVVAEHPVGSTLSIRYDPDSPAESFWGDPERKGRGTLSYVPAGAGALFVMIGAAIVSAGLWPARKRERRSNRPALPGGRLPRENRAGEVWGLAIFCLVWYSILSVVMLGFLGVVPESGFDFWGPMAFLGIFALAGLWPLVRAVRSVARLPAPHYDLLCPRPDLVRGEGTTLTYRLAGGRPEDIAALEVVLSGRRRHTVRHRNGSRMEFDRLSETTVFRSTVANSTGQGYFLVEPAADALPSGRQPDGTAVEWRLVLRGKRPGKPDILDVYPVSVR